MSSKYYEEISRTLQQTTLLSMINKHSLVVLLLCFIQCSLFSKETTLFIEDLICCSDTAIVIDPLPGVSPVTGPRSPALIPIVAYYDSSVSSVLLSFKSNLGVIEVEVLNSTTGGYSSIFVDTQFLYSVIPITLGSGHYIIIFTLPSGQQYQGEFDI